MKKWLLASVLFIFSLCSWAIDESGPGNGTDYVKVLFAEAHQKLLGEIATVDDQALQTLNIDASIRDWLSAPMSTGGSRWENMKHYLRIMDLRFQQQPCTDFTQKPASICYFNDPVQGPYVMISLQDNKMTTSDQAMAMLIHESGHFIGEPDHLFLDKVGVQMVAAMAAPTLLIADADNTETVPDVFTAKSDCEAGTSDQADQLKKSLVMDLTVQCGQKQLSCDMSNVQFVFSGVANFVSGVGYDMSVTCHGRAVLNLR